MLSTINWSFIRLKEGEGVINERNKEIDGSVASWYGKTEESKVVCLSVCLFVCLFMQFFSAVFDPISIKLGHMLYVWV